MGKVKKLGKNGNEDLKFIKLNYSDDLARICLNTNFATMFEKTGKLSRIISTNFAKSRCIGDYLKTKEDRQRFYNYVNSFDKERLNKKIQKNYGKSPRELLNEAGYELYECKTEAEIQQFRHYYKRNDDITPVYEEGKLPLRVKGEEICTFNGDRLTYSHVFFIVKKNVEEIKRENFPNPQREDEYGTSVLSIQFTRAQPHTLSIICRYNETITNPNAVYGNDLEKIAKGLTESFNVFFGLKEMLSDECFIMPGPFVNYNGKYYKYNAYWGVECYCENNIMIGTSGLKTFGNNLLLIDNYVIDSTKDSCKIYQAGSVKEKDAFIDSIGDIISVQRTRIEGTTDSLIKLKTEKGTCYITIDKSNSIIGYSNDYCTEIGNAFLKININLKKLQLPNVKKIGNISLIKNTELEELDLDNCESIGRCFLHINSKLKKINAPKLADEDCNTILERINSNKTNETSNIRTFNA